MSSSHALILPFPAQGHVNALMQLSYCLIDRGFIITFVNSAFNHQRIAAVTSAVEKRIEENIRMVAIPDGLEPHQTRDDLGALIEAFMRVMPACLEDLIMAGTFTCFIVDANMAWALPIGRRLGLRTAAFWPCAGGVLHTIWMIEKLREDGVIDENGKPIKEELCQLSPELNLHDTSMFSWNCFPEPKTQIIAFHYLFNNTQIAAKEKYIICNSFYDLEEPIFSHQAPSISPIGPIHTIHQHNQSSIGSFWLEDKSCIDWLDNKPPNSVVYVAFGSFAVFNEAQFDEIALGLELMDRPFLWVVRPGITYNTNNIYSLKERVKDRCIIVEWCPQQRVLQHPAIACFISHCGWNSTLEGVANGIPFLCFPYFGDQFYNQNYICNVWKIGLRLIANENGIVSNQEISSKVEDLLRDENIKKRSIALKEKAHNCIEKGGLSCENFNRFVDGMRLI